MSSLAFREANWRANQQILSKTDGMLLLLLLATSHIKIPAVQVVVPGTYMEYTSRRVLTSTWIDGEKLSQSKADNVAELVNVGVVAYLHQLLDIGVVPHLHCC